MTLRRNRRPAPPPPPDTTPQDGEPEAQTPTALAPKRLADRIRTVQIAVEIALVVAIAALAIGAFTGTCQGPAGPKGPPGDIGPKGPVGPAGATTTVTATGPTGPQGPRGEAGPTGSIGPIGPQGLPGLEGLRGVVGPAGKDGALGPKGDAGPVGPTGPSGPKGDNPVLFPPPESLFAPNLNFTVFFTTDGILAENAPNGGMELGERATRRTIDLRGKQAIRAQYAHTLNSATVKLAVYWYVQTQDRWAYLVAPYGAAVEPRANQTSEWYAIPVYGAATDQFLIRAIVFGDGALDPRFLYLELDAR